MSSPHAVEGASRKTRSHTAAIALLSVAVAASMTACAPIPHRHYEAAMIAGVIVENGRPVSGLDIHLTTTSSKRHSRAMTDAAGRFIVGPLREIEWIMPLVGDPVFGFRLEISRGEQTFFGYTDGGVGFSPKRLNLACDLSTPIPPLPRVRAETSYCRVSPS